MKNKIIFISLLISVISTVGIFFLNIKTNYDNYTLKLIISLIVTFLVTFLISFFGLKYYETKAHNKGS